MFRLLVAGIAALSLMIAPATPAAADGLDREDVGKLLFGLVAIAGVKAALENRQERRERDAAQTRQRSETAGSWSDLNRPRPRADDRSRELPIDCLQTLNTRFGQLRLFGAYCLQRNFSGADRLPAFCEVRVHTDRGPRTGYDPQCLRDRGYTTSRRH